MPNQAGSLPAKSKRSSSSRTGDTSCLDHTGERWVSPVEALWRPRLSSSGAPAPASTPPPHPIPAPELPGHSSSTQSWGFVSHVRLEAGPAWGERGSVEPFLGGLHNRRTQPGASVFLDVAIEHRTLFSLLSSLRRDYKTVQFVLGCMCVCV